MIFSELKFFQLEVFRVLLQKCEVLERSSMLNAYYTLKTVRKKMLLTA